MNNTSGGKQIDSFFLLLSINHEVIRQNIWAAVLIHDPIEMKHKQNVMLMLFMELTQMELNEL